MGAPYTTVARRLKRTGLLPLADATLPSVTTLVAGEPVRGSWWGHPAGHAIFAVCERLSDREDVLTAKLLAGKVTFVHARLWPALAGVGRAPRQAWRAGLSAAARRLRERVGRAGHLRTDEVRGAGVAQAARELELALAVLSLQVHTESGAHARELESWPHFVERTGVTPLPAAAARTELESAAAALAGPAARLLPWQRVGRRR